MSSRLSSTSEFTPAVFIGALAMLCPLAQVWPKPPIPAQPPIAVEREIARLEEAYSQSFASGDAGIAARLVSDDFVGYEPNGKDASKASVLADVRSEPRSTTIKIVALSVRVHGDTAIALGSEEDTGPAPGNLTHRRWLDTWKKTLQGWRLIASGEVKVLP